MGRSTRVLGAAAPWFFATMLIASAGASHAAAIHSSAWAGAYTSYEIVGPTTATWDTSQPWTADVVASSSAGPASATNPGGTYKGASAASFASADLSTGTLKASEDAALAAGALATNARASAVAQFGDQFTILSTNAGPYAWTSATTVRFEFDVSGKIVTTSGSISGFSLDFAFAAPGALASNGTSNGSRFPSGMVSGGVTVQDMCTFQPGSAESLLGQIDCGGAISIDSGGNVSGSVFAEFAPGGDFDWYAGLSLFGWPGSFGSGPGASAMDFSQTVEVAYFGPSDSVTYSASGVFPGTTALAPVPEPPSVVMVLAGFALLWFSHARLPRPARGSRSPALERSAVA